MSTQFHGLWPALVTPLDGQGNPAFDVLEKLTQLLTDQGMEGLYITGSTGQWPLLKVEERQKVAECVIQAARGGLAVMVHVGAMTTEESMQLARHARQAGADAISAVAPIYFNYFGADVAFEHFRRIAQAGELPFFAYHFSGAGQVALPPREYVDRLLAIPNIAGMKFTDMNLYTLGLLHTHAGGRLKIFSGFDENLCHAVLSGAVGAIGTFYNLWGPACQKALRQTAAGNMEAGRRFMLRFQAALAEVLGAGSMWSFLRAGIRLKYGLDVGMPREPLGSRDIPWKEADVQRLIDQVDSALD